MREHDVRAKHAANVALARKRNMEIVFLIDDPFNDSRPICKVESRRRLNKVAQLQVDTSATTVPITIRLKTEIEARRLS